MYVDAFTNALSLFAYHISVLHNSPDSRIKLYFYGVAAEYQIIRDPEHGPIWDSVYFKGTHIGNRCAMREHYTVLCASRLADMAKNPDRVPVPGPVPFPVPVPVPVPGEAP